MSEPSSQQSDDTRARGPTQSGAAGEHGVLGADADRRASPGAGSGGLPGGADGETGAHEQLRQDRASATARSAPRTAATSSRRQPSARPDDPRGGSIQEHGLRPEVAPRRR